MRDTVYIERQFTGTATTCDGRACNMDNMFILGFDTCDDCGGHECVHWPWENILKMCSHREPA